MKSRDFCYWLQGFFELSNGVQITPEQSTVIRNHLNMVFKHEIDPSNGTPEHNQELAKLHYPPGVRGGVGSGGTGPGLALDPTTIMNC